jgi:hypothetical protein
MDLITAGNDTVDLNWKVLGFLEASPVYKTTSAQMLMISTI